MRTSIDIEDKLLRQAKRHALTSGTTLKAVVEEGLRNVLSPAKPSRQTYKFDPPTVNGNGLQNGLREGDWDAIRDLIYPIPENFKK